jgi:hypothetical protein
LGGYAQHQGLGARGGGAVAWPGSSHVFFSNVLQRDVQGLDIGLMVHLAQSFPVATRPRLAFDRLKDDSLTLASDEDLVTRKPEFLGQAHRLRAPVLEQLGRYARCGLFRVSAQFRRYMFMSVWYGTDGVTQTLSKNTQSLSNSCQHWSFAECRQAFAWSLDTWLYFGGYPGSAPLVEDEAAWKRYVTDSLIEAVLARDVLLLQPITKPVLLRHLFALAATYPAQVLSYNKMLGQLQDAGNTSFSRTAPRPQSWRRWPTTRIATTSAATCSRTDSPTQPGTR